MATNDFDAVILDQEVKFLHLSSRAEQSGVKLFGFSSLAVEKI